MNNKKRYITSMLPVIQILSTYLSFIILVNHFGLKIGYFLGFVFYWCFWCLFIPYLLLGNNSFKSMFKNNNIFEDKIKWLNLILLIIPPILAFIFGPFLERIQSAPLYVILLSIPYGMINGIAEEVLWRGLFIKIFPVSFFWGFLYPSLGFALSHAAPLAVNPSSIGVIPFIASALFIGLCWGWVAFRTKSIRWTIISHILLDISGIGVLFYFN